MEYRSWKSKGRYIIFDIYADTEAVDDDPDMEALRAEEQELLATDDPADASERGRDYDHV